MGFGRAGDRLANRPTSTLCAQRGWTRNVGTTALSMILGGVVIYGVGVTWLHLAE